MIKVHSFNANHILNDLHCLGLILQHYLIDWDALERVFTDVTGAVCVKNQKMYLFIYNGRIMCRMSLKHVSNAYYDPFIAYHVYFHQLTSGAPRPNARCLLHILNMATWLMNHWFTTHKIVNFTPSCWHVRTCPPPTPTLNMNRLWYILDSRRCLHRWFSWWGGKIKKLLATKPDIW